MSSSGVLEALARAAGDALSPLALRLQAGQAGQVLEELGMRLPVGTLASGAVSQRLQQSAAACASLPEAVADLAAAISGSDDNATIAAALQLANRIAEAGAAFAQLGVALDASVQGSAGLSAAQKARLGGLAAALPERLLHLSLMTWVEDRQPELKAALDFAGLFDDVPVPGDATDASLPPHRVRRLRLDRFGALFGDPAQHLSNLYGFGKSDFDGVELFRRIKERMDAPDLETLLIEAPGQPTVLEAFLFRLAVEPGATPGLNLRLRRSAEKDIGVSIPIGGPWSVSADSKSRFEGGIELLLDPKKGLRIEPPAAAASVDAAFGLKAENGDGSPMILIGQAGGSRLELQRFSSRLPLRLSAAPAAASPTVAMRFEAEIKGGKIVVDTSQGDGFISRIVGGTGFETEFDLDAFYDTERGLHFAGSATIEIALPTHVELGPLKIPMVYLIGGFDSGDVLLEFSANLGVQLGPLAASVDRLGVEATITFPSAGGNAGVAQIDLDFKPPNGVGLSIDAAMVKGGGYLFIDADRGEYAGALELRILDFLTVTAIGVITTKMPDGSKGFAFIAIISVEFNPGLQLGFGFTLLGVGGLVGLNRSMDLDALVHGVRAGSLDSILFPKDVVANAPRIISDLRSFFPPEQGTFLIGPMGKLGWGTPTLISLSLGILIEIPGNVAIVGKLTVAIPDERLPLIIIRVAFMGALEFDKKRGWFFATLYESRVIYMPLDGGIGVLAAFGNDANFIVSVGGFHPAYKPPALPFPPISRIAINILHTPLARIRVDAYFAVTSNTVQFGARAELYFGIKIASIEGHLGFDALFQFSPFYFIITISASLSVKLFGRGVFSVGFSGSLEGTSPWHVEGTGRIKILFFKIKVDFSRTWGDKEDTRLPPILVVPILVAELEKDENWTAQLANANQLLVSLRTIDPGAELVLHPVGSLKVTQRAIPLGLTLDKIGNQRPDDANRFTLDATTVGIEKRGIVRESFSMGQFKDMKDSEKLSAADYEKEDAGLELSITGNQTNTSFITKRIARYEQIIIDSNFKRAVFHFVTLAGGLFTHFLGNNAVARAEISAKSKDLKHLFDEKIEVHPNSYVVVGLADNAPVNGAPASFASRASANEFMTAETARNPDFAKQAHIVRPHEMKKAA